MQRDGRGVVGAALRDDQPVRAKPVQFAANTILLSALKGQQTEQRGDGNRNPVDRHAWPQRTALPLLER